MSKINTAVATDYIKYLQFIEERKNSLDRTIVVCDKKNSRPDKLYKESKLIADWVSNDIDLMIECNAADGKAFKFQFRAKQFSDEPLFRLDSDGAAHRNSKFPLKIQQVTTPHFNKFNEHGRVIAYKTSQLKNENEAKAIQNDINLGFAHFCYEGNIRYKEDDLSEISLVGSSNQLDLDFKDSPERDFLENIHFNI
ncbi:MAG: hypothetical protein H0W62_01860 [Chitinophagales bacterium]|nr:hypothetical protein [Chitinophagales bacterium]